MATNDYIARWRGSALEAARIAAGLAVGVAPITWPEATGNYPATLLPNNGTSATGISLATDATRGPVASFNGTSGYAQTPQPCTTLIGAATELAIAAWCNPSSLTADRRLISLPNVAGTGSAFAIGFGRSAGRFFCFCRNGAGSLLEITSTATYGAGWHHVAATYAQSVGVTLYVDGQAAGANATAGAATLAVSSSFGIGIGAFNGSPVSNRMSGLLDDPRLYARAPSPSEIAAIAAGDDTAGAARVRRLLCCGGGD